MPPFPTPTGHCGTMTCSAKSTPTSKGTARRTANSSFRPPPPDAKSKSSSFRTILFSAHTSSTSTSWAVTSATAGTKNCTARCSIPRRLLSTGSSWSWRRGIRAFAPNTATPPISGTTARNRTASPTGAAPPPIRWSNSAARKGSGCMGIRWSGATTAGRFRTG